MIAQKTPKKFLLAIFALGLSGCSALGGGAVQPIATEPDVVSTRIAQAAERASAALDTIAGIDQQRAPAMPAPDDFSNAPPALNQPITVKWSGPADQLVETLAARTGMRFRTSGNRSGVPLIINLNVYQKPVVEVLRDIGLQIGRRADIAVDGANNVVEIRYASIDRT